MSLLARNISVSFGPRRILDDIDADIPPGRITAILGPNGAGKTTLLRVLSGDLRPGHGTVTLGGADIVTLSAFELAARRAVLPQHTRPAFGFKAWQIVQLGRAPFGDNKAQSLDHVAAALSRVDAAHLADREVSTLSGGERQRIFLAKALCQAEGRGERRGTLLLDEPAAALDMKQAASLMRILKDTARSGIGIALITHDVHTMRRHADRYLLVEDGRVESCERADALNNTRIAALYDMAVDDVAA